MSASSAWNGHCNSPIAFYVNLFVGLVRFVTQNSHWTSLKWILNGRTQSIFIIQVCQLERSPHVFISYTGSLTSLNHHYNILRCCEKLKKKKTTIRMVEQRMVNERWLMNDKHLRLSLRDSVHIAKLKLFHFNRFCLSIEVVVAKYW